MPLENATLNHRFDSSLKRREDVSVEELKGLPWFQGRSDEELAAIIEVAKGFTRVVLGVCQRETPVKRKGKAIDLTIISNPQNKAA